MTLLNFVDSIYVKVSEIKVMTISKTYFFCQRFCHKNFSLFVFNILFFHFFSCQTRDHPKTGIGDRRNQTLLCNGRRKFWHSGVCIHVLHVIGTAHCPALHSMAIFNFFGTTASGWLSDRYDNRVLLAVYYALRGVSLIILPFSMDSSEVRWS